METYERRALPEGWEWKKIGDVGVLHDGDWILNKNYSEDGVRLMLMSRDIMG